MNNLSLVAIRLYVNIFIYVSEDDMHNILKDKDTQQMNKYFWSSKMTF